MNNKKRCQEWVAEALYSDLPEDKKQMFEDHLLQCDSCSDTFAEMSSTLGIMDKRKRPEPDDHFWEGYWDRLTARMQAEKVFTPQVPEKSRRLFFGVKPFPRWAFQAAAATALIVVGIFLGRVLFAPGPQGIQTAGLETTQPQVSPGIQLAERTEAYVQRSKLLLMGLVNFDPAEQDLYTLDLPYQRQASRDLLQEAGWLKQELGNSRQRRLQELVADLEAILLQIANLEAEEDLEAVELVQTGVESRGIFLKIHLADVAGSFESLESAQQKKPATDKSQRF
jgi:hypothetical protein